ncbi:MAG: pyrroloquinoline quinone-dependent dehydrogenase [Vicinamibacterales bacterium]
MAQNGTAQNTATSKEWPTYGHDSGGMRFSPLTEITPANASQLAVAWVYHMKPPSAPASAVPTTGPNAPGASESAAAAAPAQGARGGRGAVAPETPAAAAAPPQGARGGRGAGAQVGEESAAPAGGRGRGRGASATGFSGSGVTPLVINGTMYISTPYYRVVALDATTGKEVWVYQMPSGNPSTKGLEYWPGDAQTPAQLVFGSSDGKLYSLDAKTGKPNPAFGTDGVVQLDTPEVGGGGLGAPPKVYRNLVITGSRNQENPPQGPAGDVRAWDMHTGKLAWSFRSIPRKGEKGNETWAADSWVRRTGVNVWGFITVDAERGIAYLPFGAPSVDQYGGDREGDNLFSTSLVAVEAATGKYLWHFQVVHHDIWDADMTGAPLLMDVRQGGKTIPAVAAINKVGLLFILDRVTGKPIYGVEDRPVPQSEVPLERSAKTQPFPVKPAPLARMGMTPADLATVTPELEAACKKLMEGLQFGGPYLPVSYNRLGVRFPGNHGGVNWGGTSFNPQLGYLFVNINNLGQISGLKDRDPGVPGPARGEGQGNRVLPEGPYSGVPGGGRFSIRNGTDPQQLPCQQPPWGELVAVNANTGEFAWRVPLGVTDSLPADKQKTGRPGNGGTIATAGGVVFVGATDDSRFRAFDGKTGKELWTFKLGGAAEATPMTYQGRDGRQYVAIAGTGGGFFNNPTTDDSLTVFALPARR